MKVNVGVVKIGYVNGAPAAPTLEAIAEIAEHDVMKKIDWTNLQHTRTAEVEHAEILVAVVGGDYRNGSTVMQTRRIIVNGDADIGDYAAMADYYRTTANRIAEALAPYCAKAEAGDRAARHVLTALRKRHVWERVCFEADAFPAERLDYALDALYAEGQFIAFTR